MSAGKTSIDYQHCASTQAWIITGCASTQASIISIVHERKHQLLSALCINASINYYQHCSWTQALSALCINASINYQHCASTQASIISTVHQHKHWLSALCINTDIDYQHCASTQAWSISIVHQQKLRLSALHISASMNYYQHCASTQASIIISIVLQYKHRLSALCINANIDLKCCAKITICVLKRPDRQNDMFRQGTEDCVTAPERPIAVNYSSQFKLCMWAKKHVGFSSPVILPLMYRMYLHFCPGFLHNFKNTQKWLR